MNYLHHPAYPYGVHAGIHLDQPGLVHPAIANNIDGYVLTRPAYELADYYTHMPLMEDYEEYSENLSRPRLTKEQVDTLEAQFQAHPKPNSNKKRELAVQTNLSLPRVANWFQNRRAKAKQQKRQEEFERMQREAKEKEDQSKSIKDEEQDYGLPGCDQKSPIHKDDNSHGTTKSPTPTQASNYTKDRPQTSDSSSLSRPKHQKTGSDLAQEKTYASLQRAISAAVAARDQYTGPSDDHISVGPTDRAFDVRQTNIPVPSANNTPQTSANSTLSEWGSSRDSSIAWTPSQSPEEGYEFGSLNNVPFASEVAQMDNSPNPDVSTSHGFGSITSRSQQMWNPQFQGRAEIHASDPMYGSLSYSSLQPPSATSSRRPSASEELADSISGIGINTAALAGSMDSSMWRRPEKELDIAARRKRPRPAAIGTAHHRLSTNPSMVSPNARMATFGAPHTIRHAKSSHTLGSRYAGVRKLSATQRSPLGYSSFAEAATAAAANASSESRQKHRLHTSASVGNLAPPTPLTPEDFQHMLLTPTTSDTQMNFSTPHLTDTQGNFPVTQSMQINVASPPETPLTLDVFSAMQYQNMAPPLSATPQYASFTDYSPITSEPLTGVSWAVSTPDASLFPSSLQSQRQQPPIYIYEQDDDEHQDPKWTLSGDDGSSLEEHDPNGMTQFHIHEFPKQQEAHRNVAQQLAPQIPKNYTFSNQTPSDF
ncbi:hypothetical protein EYB25_008046 [Talaromyces marneffei]|nr:hypothetical protein EYB25_008046 [Talaromyces marneffei]